jgi:hypothetical protein
VQASIQVLIPQAELDLASSLLPLRSWLNIGMLLHIHLHALGQKRYADRSLNRDAMHLGDSVECLKES